MNYFFKHLNLQLNYIFFLTILLFSNAATAINPKVGTWWSPSEPGRGYVIDGSGTVLALSAYTYDRSGQPLWYLAVGQLTNGGANWSGTLEKYIGGQCLGCAYQPNQSNGSDGIISVQFTSDTTGIMTMPNGAKSNIQSYFPVGTYPVGGTAPTIPTGLAALYGTVTLNYKFNSSSTIYTESFTYSSSNLVSASAGEGLYNHVIGNSNRVASCFVAPTSTGYGYLCGIGSEYVSSNDSVDLFLFNLNSSKGINGRYSHCSVSAANTCAASMLTSPDGVVSGNVVSANASTVLVPTASTEIDYSDAKAEAALQQSSSNDGAVNSIAADPAAVNDLAAAIKNLIR